MSTSSRFCPFKRSWMGRITKKWPTWIKKYLVFIVLFFFVANISKPVLNLWLRFDPFRDDEWFGMWFRGQRSKEFKNAKKNFFFALWQINNIEFFTIFSWSIINQVDKFEYITSLKMMNNSDYVNDSHKSPQMVIYWSRLFFINILLYLMNQWLTFDIPTILCLFKHDEWFKSWLMVKKNPNFEN